MTERGNDFDYDLARRVARATLLERALIIVLIGGLGILIVIGTIVILTMRQTQNDIRATQIAGTPTGQRLLASAATIEDCTTPGGKCYERSQRSTAEAVGNINEVIVLAAACSVGLDPNLTVLRRQNVVQKCVIEGLADD